MWANITALSNAISSIFDIICLNAVKNTADIDKRSARSAEFAFPCRFFLLHSEDMLISDVQPVKVVGPSRSVRYNNRA
jgi:hypothetical protein